MKNFTINFKQFTSRLSARWLIMALMMLVGTSSAWAANITGGTKLYFKSNSTWDADGARYAAYFCNGTSAAKWYSMTKSGDYWTCTVSSGESHKNVIFCRMNPNTTSNNWNDAFWGGQTKDLTWDGSNNLATIKNDGNMWDKNEDVSWSCYDDVTAYTVSGTGSTVKLSDSDTWVTYTLYKDDTAVSSSDKRGTGSALSWDVTESGTYTVKGTNGCRTDAMSSSYTYSSCVTVNTPDVSADKSAVCKGGTVTLNLNSRQDGVTYKIGNTEIFSGSTTTYEFTPTGNVSVEASHANSCDGATATKNITIRVDEPSELTFTYAETTICKGEEVTLDDFVYSHTGTVTWYNSYSYVDSNKATDVVSPTSTHKYYATAKNGECSIAEAQLNVIVNKPPVTPTLSAENDVTEIISGSTTATLVVGNTENGATYTLYKDGVSTGNTGTRFEGISQKGTYTVVGNNNNGCGDSDFSDPIDITLCEPITGLTWSITEGEKDVYCPGDEVTVTMTYNGSEAKAHVWGGNWIGNIDILPDDYATGTVYTMTINKSGSVDLTLTGCDGKTAKTSTLEFEVVEAPVKPTITFSANPVGQNKPTTLTVGGYNGTLNNYTLYKDGDSQGAYTTPQTITIGEVDEYDYYVVATSKACPSLTATSETVTLEVQEAGAKIVQLGDLVLYTNDNTDFVPMYVQKDGIVDIDGATKVEGYTWEYSANGTSGWAACSTGYLANGVGMDNGGGKCNNWRANAVGYYRCKITYDNGSQYSNSLHVTEGTNNKTNKQHISAQRNLPIISVNTGAKSFPSDPANGYPSANADDLKAKISVDVKIFNADGTLHYDRKARMNYRGSSSLNFKKKSYAFVTGKEKTKNDAGDVDTGKANLFGLSDGAEDKDWVLYAATPDPTMMRNRLTFDLYQQMRQGEWGVNSKYVELVINGEYMGVYVLMDKITENEKRINITAGDGFIVKFDKTDVADRYVDGKQSESDEKTFKTERTGRKGISTYGTYVDQLFEIEYPEKEDTEDAGGNWASVVETIKDRFEKFETALANKDYTAVRTLIDYDSWADWFILTEFIKNQDGFRASCIFVYNGGKIEARPLWDQELSFDNRTRMAHGSNSAEDLMIKSDGVYSDCFPAPFWFYGKNATFGTCGNNNGSSGSGTRYSGYLLADPCFVSLVKSKWATYQTGILSANNISDMVEDYATELGNAQTREESRWPYNEGTRGTTKNGLYIGYYAGEGDSNYFGYSASKGSITTWATNRSTPLGENTNGLGEALYNLEGDALIFTINPSTIETSPWQQNVITVNAPKGYEYIINFSALTNVGTEVKENGDSYTFKVPRPNGWGTAGNGTAQSVQYTISATIDAEGENACGTQISNTATSVVTLKDVTENCSPEVKP